MKGQSPVWVFKSGEQGLGYYPDLPKPAAVSLWGEICPSGGRLAVPVPLSELIVPEGNPEIDLACSSTSVVEQQTSDAADQVSRSFVSQSVPSELPLGTPRFTSMQ